LEQQIAGAAAVLPRPGESSDQAEQLAKLNDELAHIGAASPQQRKRLEEQYARVAGMLLAGMSGAATGSARTDASSLPNLDALAQFEPAYLLADGGKIGFVLSRL